MEKNRQKGVQAGQDKVQAEADLQANNTAIESKKAEVSAAPSEANTEALQKLMKDGDKLKDRIQRLGDQAVNADEKVKQLEGTIKKNLSDQEVKLKAIETQRAKVEELTNAVANVN
jgi:chaperonin cofactor prefoldin